MATSVVGENVKIFLEKDGVSYQLQGLVISMNINCSMDGRMTTDFEVLNIPEVVVTEARVSPDCDISVYDMDVLSDNWSCPFCGTLHKGSQLNCNCCGVSRNF